MPKHHSDKRSPRMKPSGKTPPAESGIELARRAALAALVALLVATPLIPSESAAELGTGALLIMLWLLLLVAWLVTTLLCKQTAFRFGRIDTAVVVFLVLHSLSAIITAGGGHARPTINMLWQWLSFGVCFLLARQLIRTAAETRVVCAVMISLAVALSMLGYYQQFHSMAQLRDEYERDPDRVLREAGIDPTPGSPEKKLFKDRLDSTEPMATFALTNSLAGLLATWLMVAVGIGVSAWRNMGLRWQTLAGVAVCCLVIGFCLFLTKSRTAVIALIAGLVFLAWHRWRRGRRIDWRIVAVGGAVFAALLAGAITAGSFDWLVLSETPKSALYRIQYWRATMAMISDYPYFGCGPGHFQQYYTAYKLPEASETIADPHNFLLEVWSTAGTPVMLAFVSILLLFAWRLVRAGEAKEIRGPRSEVTSSENGERRRAIASTLRFVYGGALFGIFFAFPCGMVVGFMPDVALLWIGLPMAAVCAGLLHAWTVDGALRAWLPAVAVAVLLINLLAAGGIGFPGVAQNLWLLLAIALCILDAERPLVSVPRMTAAGLVAVALLLTFAFHQTMYQPVLRCQAGINEGNSLVQDGEFEQAEAAYARAALADPYSAEPWMRLASLHQQLAIGLRDTSRVQQFDHAAEEALKRDPRSHATFRQLGDMRLELYRKLGGRQQLVGAVIAYERWTQLYPNSNMAHAQLAWAYRVAGDRRLAAGQAQKALDLDKLNPHGEKKLREQQVHDPANELLKYKNAEQLMYDLRSYVGES